MSTFFKKNHRFFLLLVIGLVFSVTFAACGQAVEDPVDPDEPVDEGPQHGGTANIGLWSAPNTFIEYFSLGNHAIAPARLIFSSLMRRDPEGEFIPDLAERWEISDDAMEFTFYLNPDATFHDGTSVTAEDVKFTFEAIAHSDWAGSRTSDMMFIRGARSYNEGQSDSISGIDVVDDHTLVLTLEEVYAPFLERIYFMSILPKHLLGDEEIATLDETDFAMRNPVGSGPFVFTEYSSGEFLRLSRHDDFHLEGPYLDSVIIHILDQEVGIAQLETGELDGTLSHYASGISPDYVERLQGVPNVELDMPAGGSMRKIVVNHDNSPMNDARFRRALSHAYDREGFLQAVLRGYGQVAAVPLAEGNPFIYEDAEVHPYDPDKARELLEEMDYDSDQTHLFLTSDSEERVQIAELAQEWWGEVGVDIEIQMFDFPTMLGLVTDGEYDLAAMGYTTPTGEPDAVLTSTLHSGDAAPGGWNFSRVRISEIDELLDKARSEPDFDARRQYYIELQKILPEHTPEIYLAVGAAISARSERMQNFEDGIFYRTQTPHLWWIQE